VRAVVLRSLAVVAVGSLILAGVLYVASTVDGRPPTVVSIGLTQPLPDEPTRGLSTTSLEITFTEPVEARSAAAALSIEPAVDGAFSPSGSVIIFTPAEPLELSTEYTVSIAAGVEDLAGNRMTDLPPAFTFETAGPPEVVETDPADRAQDVPLEAPITIRFSTLMDTASVEAALRLTPAFAHEVRWSGQLLEIVPAEPLRPEAEYRVQIGEGAFDVSGVALDGPVGIGFRTIAPGLDLSLVVPADASDGIAPTAPIAVLFDRPIDPGSISDELMTITPDVAGSLEVVDELGEEPAVPEDGRILRFTPSGPLPTNTTFDVVLERGVAGLAGGGLAEPVSWSFTTGAPQSTISNQVTFLSDRGGVPNLWAMNPDGTAAHQLSTELAPVLDYAVAPDGSSFVVGEGRRLVMVDADGSNRRVLTEDGFWEFDPTYAPNGQRLVFARADAESGRPLGIWERPIPGDVASRIEMPVDGSPSPTPLQSGEADDPASWLRAPRFAPDGDALAFVDGTGAIGILDLEAGTLSRVEHDAQAPPIWLSDGSALLVTGRSITRPRDPESLEAPIGPLAPRAGASVGVLDRAGDSIEPSALGPAAAALAVAPDGRIAYLGTDGSLRLSDGPDERGRVPAGLEDERIGDAGFAPGEAAMVVVVLREDEAGPTGEGSIVRVDLGQPRTEILANDGWRPRWLP
jgi:hypothetical protein